jgi:hypothetical protein
MVVATMIPRAIAFISFLCLTLAAIPILADPGEPPAWQDRRNAPEAAAIDVSPSSWRSVQESLDDVFSDEQIIAIRKPAMQQFIHAMTSADTLDDWPLS